MSIETKLNEIKKWLVSKNFQVSARSQQNLDLLVSSLRVNVGEVGDITIIKFSGKIGYSTVAWQIQLSETTPLPVILQTLGAALTSF